MESFHSSLRHHPLIRYQSTGHFLRQNKSTLEPKKPSFKIFELFLLSKLVCTYDKQNIYAKKIFVSEALWTMEMWWA